MSDMKNVGDGTTFSMRQMIAMLSAATVLSGGGAAITVSANDAEQNEKIAVQDTRLVTVELSVTELKKTQTEVRDIVITMKPQVDSIKKDVDLIREDMKKVLEGLAQDRKDK